MDYQEAASWAVDHMQSYRKDPSGWRSCKRTNEISISWRPSTEFHGNVYKAEGIMPAKPADVFKCIKPETGGLREQWDQNVKEVTVIDTINENVVVTRTTTPSAFMKVISPREFLDVVQIKEDEDGTFASMATNVEHPLCPPLPNYAVGVVLLGLCAHMHLSPSLHSNSFTTGKTFTAPDFSIIAAYLCTSSTSDSSQAKYHPGSASPPERDPCKTQLLSFFQTDLRGNLPQTVVESFFPSSISGFYSGLTKAVVKLVA